MSTAEAFRHVSELFEAFAGSSLHRNGEAWSVLSVIVNASGSTGSCFLNDATIAERAGLHPKSVRGLVERIASIGFLEFERGRHRGRATVYRVPLDRADAARSTRPSPRADAPEKGESSTATLSAKKGESSRGERVVQEARKGSPNGQKGESSWTPPTSINQREPETKNRDPELVSRSRSRDPGPEKTPPPPPHDASIEALCRHALDTGGRGTSAVVPRLAVLMGLEPDSEDSHRRVARFVWDAVRGSEPERSRLLSAARWADKARNPRYRAERPTFLGFTLVAKGDNVPWPEFKGSEADTAAPKRPTFRPYVHPDVALARAPEALFSEAPRPSNRSTQADELAKFEAFKARKKQSESAPPPMPPMPDVNTVLTSIATF